MDKRGYTLIELLGVIILISLIMILILPKITNSVGNQTEKTDKITEDIIYKATQLYVEDNSDQYRKKTDAIYCISINDLVNSEYLNNSSINNIIDTKTVKVTSKKNFKYELVDNNNCIEKFPPLEPDLHNNSLIPVMYKNNNWIVVDKESNEWYDYEKQEWANAVILKSGIIKNIGDIVDVNSEVQGMFVWIPRYEYKIEGTYGKNIEGISGTQDFPGEIKINFIYKLKSKASEGYIIHPAFTFGDKTLSGIWVGKFETTGTIDNPTILPNTVSLRNQNISTLFATAQNFNQYLSNGDSHMSKNIEWGAIAYLSQSKYGKYGNSKYVGADREIAINNCSNYITGVGGNTVNEEESIDTCSTNTYETEKGQSASTTGNITGVYDMSGGSLEYVMGYYTSSSSIWGATSEENYSEFTSTPENKYFDEYTSDVQNTACNRGICYGHALSETAGWYKDNSNFVNAITPWLLRGGNYNGSFETGIFSFYSGTGAIYNSASFRIIIS